MNHKSLNVLSVASDVYLILTGNIKNEMLLSILKYQTTGQLSSAAKDNRDSSRDIENVSAENMTEIFRLPLFDYGTSGLNLKHENCWLRNSKFIYYYSRQEASGFELMRYDLIDKEE